MPIEVKHIELPSGVNLQYAEQGEKSGIPIILIHGLSDIAHRRKRNLKHLGTLFYHR